MAGDFEVIGDPIGVLPAADARDIVRQAEGQQPGAPQQSPAAAMQGDFEVVDISAPVQQREAVLPGVTRSFFQGLLLNFGDEAESVARSVLAGVGFDVDRMSAEEIQSSIDRFAEQNPGLATLAEVGGAVVLPGGAAARGATLGARMLRGAGVGGITGTVAGAGAAEGGVGERLVGAAQGGAAGALLGAGAAPVIEGVIRGGQRVARAAERAGAPVRGLFSPQTEAARQVALAREADVASRAAQLGASPGSAVATGAEQVRRQVLEAARAEGVPVTNIEFGGGEATRGLLRAAANQSPEGRDVLANLIDTRFEGQGARIEEMLSTILPSRQVDTFTLRNQLQARARRARRPAYERAYREGDRPLRSEELDRLLAAPAVVDALRGAATRGRNRLVAEGQGGFNPQVTITDDGRVQFRRGAGGLPLYPNLQTWDLAKRELDDAARAARRQGRNEEAAAVTSLTADLRDELDRLVPSYARARGIAQRFFNADDALQAGENFARQTRFSLPEARKALSEMNDAERQLFASGFTDELIGRINRTPDRANAVRQIFKSPDQKARIKLAIGNPAFKRLEARMNVETLMDRARTALAGNSTTARQLVELGLIGGGAGAGFSGAIDPTTLIGSALLYGGARRVRRRATERTAREVADLLLSDDPAAINQAVQRIARTPSLLEGLRRFDAALARVAGQQAGQFASQGEAAGTQ